MDILSGVTKRLVDIDDDLLEEVTRILGTTSMKETVNQALEEVVKLAHRREHILRLRTKEGLDLDEVAEMAKAWR